MSYFSAVKLSDNWYSNKSYSNLPTYNLFTISASVGFERMETSNGQKRLNLKLSVLSQCPANSGGELSLNMLNPYVPVAQP